MLYGIGTDILNINQIESSVSDRQDPFVRKIYTPAEIELIESRPLPLYSYATRFAGKEAVFKALNLNGNAIRLNEIEIWKMKTDSRRSHCTARQNNWQKKRRSRRS